MENCKYCQAELEENSAVCPACGKDQMAPEAVEAPAAELPAEEASAAQPAKSEIKEGAKATPGLIAAIVVLSVLLVAALIALVMMGSSKEKNTPPETQSQVESVGGEEAAEPTDLMAVEATIPADGNPEDVTCKGTYTAEDAAVLAAADTVVAAMGEDKLTVSQLQVYYWMEVRSFLNNLYYYGVDATYYGMDYELGLDQQQCAIAEGKTWQQYFLECALQSWRSYVSMGREAGAAGYVLEEDFRAQIDGTEESLQTQALSYGMADAQELLAANVGNGADLEDYLHFLEQYYLGYGYYNHFCSTLEPTDAEVEAFFAENEEAYAANSLTKDTRTVDVRHILVFPEGADSTSIYSETFSDEAWAAGEQQAQEILNTWLAGEKTEESFAALANEKSADPGSNTNGGLYTDVAQGDMVEEFDAWCFDAARQVGDYAVVRTDLGFHVMYFSGSNVLWQEYARQDWITRQGQTMMDTAVEANPMEVDYSTIVLGYVDLA